jgi:hypothetical protein
LVSIPQGFCLGCKRLQLLHQFVATIGGSSNAVLLLLLLLLLLLGSV